VAKRHNTIASVSVKTLFLQHCHLSVSQYRQLAALLLCSKQFRCWHHYRHEPAASIELSADAIAKNIAETIAEWLRAAKPARPQQTLAGTFLTDDGRLFG
jgi:hypothetical protein